jgi:hypothetical protein
MLDSNILLRPRVTRSNTAPSTTILDDMSRNKTALAMTALTWTKLPSRVQAQTFNGATSSISTANANSVKGKAQVTLSVWLNTAVLDGTTRYIYYECVAGSSNARLNARFTTANVLGIGGRSSDGDAFTAWVVSAKSLLINTWYHAVFVFDSVSDNHFIYLNTLPETANVVATPFTNSNPNEVPKIGVVAGGGNYFPGMLSHLRLESTAWSATRVKIEFEKYRHLFRI